MSATVHICPPGDQIGHEMDDGCLCGPSRKPVNSSDGSVEVLIVHHPLDGRAERGYAATDEGDAA